MSMIERTMMGVYTIPNIIVEDRNRSCTGKNTGEATGDKNTILGDRLCCPRFYFPAFYLAPIQGTDCGFYVCAAIIEDETGAGFKRIPHRVLQLQYYTSSKIMPIASTPTNSHRRVRKKVAEYYLKYESTMSKLTHAMRGIPQSQAPWHLPPEKD
jgi:hypothetical protein